MSNIFALTIPPTEENPTVAGGRIMQTGEVFRFEFQAGYARLYVYPYQGPTGTSHHSLDTFALNFPPDPVFLLIERQIGFGPDDNRAGRHLVIGLLAQWIPAYLNGSLPPVDLESLRALAVKRAEEKACAEQARRQQHEALRTQESLERARKVLVELPAKLRKAALYGAEKVDVWLVFLCSFREGSAHALARAQEMLETDAAAALIWRECQKYQPVIGRAKINDSGSVGAGIQIVLRPEKLD